MTEPLNLPLENKGDQRKRPLSIGDIFEEKYKSLTELLTGQQPSKEQPQQQEENPPKKK